MVNPHVTQQGSKLGTSVSSDEEAFPLHAFSWLTRLTPVDLISEGWSNVFNRASLVNPSQPAWIGHITPCYNAMCKGVGTSAWQCHSVSRP